MRNVVMCMCLGMVIVCSVSGSPIQNGEALEGTISFAGDTQPYEVSAVAGDTIVARMGKINGGIYPFVRLYDPTGHVLDSDWQIDSAEVSATATNNGTFTIVCKSQNTSTGPYAISASLVGGNTTSDIDGDGVSNTDELEAWTDPFDPSSFPAFTNMIVSGMDGPTMTWQTIGTMRYRMQYSDAILSVSFSDIPRTPSQEMETDVSEGQRRRQTFTDAFTSPQGAPTNGCRFYRVRIVR